jgi:photosynthetic reaction center cytochrome c subunit
MNKHRKLYLVMLGLTLGACLSFRPASLPGVASTPYVKKQSQQQTAEQVFRNIQVLKGIPAAQLQQVMALFTGALGVRCSHCHTNAFDKDDKPAKQTARRMVRMMLELNRANFSDQPAVTCATCHRGQLKPETVVALGKSLWLTTPTTKPEPGVLTVEQILARYVQASGGEAALRKLTTRISRGARIGADGVLVPEEVYQKAPDKLLVITKYPGNHLRAIINGARGWTGSKDQAQELSGEELAELQREATFHKELALKELYAQMSLAGKELIGERETYVINAKSHAGNPEKLYFDAQTGLLRRRYRESPTVLGPFPLQTDYEDYQKVDGVILPLTIRWSMPGRVWGRRIAEVSHNTPIEDQQFNVPLNKR